MHAFNRVTSALFDWLLWPFGQQAWLAMAFWSILGGVVALLVYKWVSNQAAITRAKEGIKVHLLEIRLFKDDLLGVVTATGRILGKNALYLGHNVLPMAVMLVPMMVILFQLEAHYAHAPLPEGATPLLTVELDRAHAATPPSATALVDAVWLDVPAGVALDAPPVHTADYTVAYRLRAATPGDHVLTVHVGETTFEKRVAVGGAPRKVPVKRTKTWEGFLYPGEDALPDDGPVETIALTYPTRALALMPDGELGILLAFFGISLAAGFALRGAFGVTF